MFEDSPASSIATEEIGRDVEHIPSKPPDQEHCLHPLGVSSTVPGDSPRQQPASTPTPHRQHAATSGSKTPNVSPTTSNLWSSPLLDVDSLPLTSTPDPGEMPQAPKKAGGVPQPGGQAGSPGCGHHSGHGRGHGRPGRGRGSRGCEGHGQVETGISTATNGPRRSHRQRTQASTDLKLVAGGVRSPLDRR